MGEYFERNGLNPITVNESGQKRAVWIDKGTNFHFSWMISRKLELAFRLASVRPDAELAGVASPVEESFVG